MLITAIVTPLGVSAPEAAAAAAVAALIASFSLEGTLPRMVGLIAACYEAC